MKIHCKYTGIKGILTVYRDSLRYRYMITDRAQEKARILVFFERHGLKTTLDAFSISFVLTDNGSEFMKHFEEELKRLHLTHYHTYPKTPKMNAHLERFNRTIQDEFVDYHVPELLSPISFNLKLIDYLVWYNTERVHGAFQNRLSPVQFLLNLPRSAQDKLPAECKSGWPHTGS